MDGCSGILVVSGKVNGILSKQIANHKIINKIRIFSYYWILFKKNLEVEFTRMVK